MEQPPIEILIVDDDAALLGIMEESLGRGTNYALHALSRAPEALRRVQEHHHDIIVTDYSLGDASIDGLTILRRALELRPTVLGIIVTAYASLEMSLEAIHLGAYDFLTKPFQIDELVLTVRNAAERVDLVRENVCLRNEVERLAKSMRLIQSDHEDLMSQLGSLKDRSAQHVSPAAVKFAPRPGMSQQAQAYLKIAETIGERLERENRRLQEILEPPSGVRRR